MSRNHWKYGIFLLFILVLYFIMLYSMPRNFNWTVTLYKNDKNPFGASVLNDLLSKSWFDSVTVSNRTIYELQDMAEPNLLILCTGFSASRSEIGLLLDDIRSGRTVILSTSSVDSLFVDSVGVEINDFSFEFLLNQLWGGDTASLHFVHPAFDGTEDYWMPSKLIHQYFKKFDKNLWTVLAENNEGNPVLLRRKLGEGVLILSSTPLMFSNFAIVKPYNDQYSAGILSFCTSGPLHWSEFYQLGRMEARTPLRYILGEQSLKWAFYIAVLSIALMMIFDAKRRQRIIPVVVPLKNETLSFVKTIARLYYNKKDHRGLALKQMLHFTEYLKIHLMIDVNENLEDNISIIASKTGTSVLTVKKLFETMTGISNALFISAAELKKFSAMIDGIMKNRNT